MLLDAAMETVVRKWDAVRRREGRGCLSEGAVGYEKGNLESRVRWRCGVVRFVVGQVFVASIYPAQ